MEKANELFNKIVNRIREYNKSDISMLHKAYELAMGAHDGQVRMSGEPYIIHPLEVAYILSDLELDTATIVAGLLHDVIEDTEYTYEDIMRLFSEEIAGLVEGVTKLGKIPYTTRKEQQAENIRKMFLAMARDIRVVLIKLSDRLHNMRTLKHMPETSQIEKAEETLEIYAPLAHRLGMYGIKWELEDLCLRYSHPQEYYDLVSKVSTKRKERETFVNQIIEDLNNKIKELNIECDIEGRPKHFYSIYRKMLTQNKAIDQIYDLFALRIIVNTVNDCYAVLGLVHELYKPLPGRIKDYIAMPKPNMYQSLHTTLVSNQGQPFEVQIRTWEMHSIAESGIAAHWKYKEGIDKKEDGESKLVWLRQMLEWQKEMHDDEQFLENLKVELFADEVFVFSPKGDVISLPAGSTPIDFAYYIHSGIGNKMMGARVNGKIIPIDYKLQNGDIVEVLTSSNVQGPSRDWLKIVKSSQARNKINQWYKKEKREENVVRGKELIEKEVKKSGVQYNELFKATIVDKVLKKYSYKNVEDLFAAVGYGAILSSKIVSKLIEIYTKTQKVQPKESIENIEVLQQKSPKPKDSPSSGVIVKGIDNCLIKYAKCCSPLPGDEIIGYITRGRGISIHRKDCTNMGQDSEENRLIEVEWHQNSKTSYQVEIQIMAHDRSMLLSEITGTIADLKLIVRAVNAKTTRDNIAIINLTLEIADLEHLSKVIKKLRRIDGIFEVSRSGRS